MITIAGSEIKKPPLKVLLSKYEYEIVLLAFLLLRFVFKYVLGMKEYFTKQPVFGLSANWSIFTGTVVLLFVCIFVAAFFGRLIRKTGNDFEKPVIFLTALFFACPASLPFLFNTASLSGTQMLYPFALFILTVFIADKPFFQWLVPLICAMYFLPALFSSEVFFAVLRKGAILYVPLILLLSFLGMMKKNIGPDNKKMLFNYRSFSFILFVMSFVVSVGSYIYTLTGSKYYWGEGFYNLGQSQKIDGYLAVCLLIASPVLAAGGMLLYKAYKNSFSGTVFDVFWRAQIVLFLLYKSNYYGLWVPFVILSLFTVIFYSIRQKNSAMLSAVRTLGEFISENKFIFYIVLIVMASLSNVTSDFTSKMFRTIFERIPF